VKGKKIADTHVSSIDTDKREVCLEAIEATYRYTDDLMDLLLQKAMTRKATFIIKDHVVSCVELTEEMHTLSR
jgi:hypothetical protein